MYARTPTFASVGQIKPPLFTPLIANEWLLAGIVFFCAVRATICVLESLFRMFSREDMFEHPSEIEFRHWRTSLVIGVQISVVLADSVLLMSTLTKQWSDPGSQHNNCIQTVGLFIRMGPAI